MGQAASDNDGTPGTRCLTLPGSLLMDMKTDLFFPLVACGGLGLLSRLGHTRIVCSFRVWRVMLSYRLACNSSVTLPASLCECGPSTD